MTRDTDGVQHSPAPAPVADVAHPTRRRIDGVDLARGLAIIGMITVHVAPPLAGDAGWYSLPYGQASTLFALVAGIGIELSSRRGPTAEHRARLVWRALWLLPVGIGLSLLGTPVAVILQYYALWFLLAGPVLRLGTRALAALTATGLLVGPTLLVWAQVTRPEWFVSSGGNVGGRGAWLGEFGDVLLTGYYPTVSWVWVVYAGMLVGRLDLRSDRVALWLLGAGVTVAAVTYRLAALARDGADLGRWQSWLDTTGHSDTPPEMLATLGVAVAVMAICLLLGRYLRPPVAPGVALGKFALTVYVGHIIVYGFARSAFYNDTVAGGVTTTLWISGVSAVVAMLWLTVLPRGPLEAFDRAGHEWIMLPIVRMFTDRPT